MELNDLLREHDVDPERTLVLRHRPSEPAFRKALALAMDDRLDLFDAYQAYQGETVERSIKDRMGGWVASFVAYGAGKAVFVGIYEIAGSWSVTRQEFWLVPAHLELKALGNPCWKDDDTRETRLLFDLRRTEILADWRGKLVVKWPPPEIGWYRRAHKNAMPVVAIREDSWFADAMPAWDAVDYTWAELRVLSSRAQDALRQWRVIYLIWDGADGKGYVGAAYGADNLMGRWGDYCNTGHGGNKHLRLRPPELFRFTILQRVSPDMTVGDITKLEASWKDRLHTRFPDGLNDN